MTHTSSPHLALGPLIALVILIGFGATSTHAIEPKTAMFAMPEVQQSDPVIQLLNRYIQAELTELHQTVVLFDRTQKENASQAIELLIIDIERSGSDHPLIVQLIQHSGLRLLHTEVVSIPTHMAVDSDQLRFIGAYVARQLVRKLDALNFDARNQASARWMSEPHTVIWHFETIDQCRQDYLITAIEDGFPGTIGIALKKSPTQNYSVYEYIGQANLQRQSQWLRTLLRFEGLQGDAFKILTSNGEIRVLFEETDALNAYICGEQ